MRLWARWTLKQSFNLKKGEKNEPFNASVITIIIAFVFVAVGNVNAVGKIISMFFMI